MKKLLFAITIFVSFLAAPRTNALEMPIYVYLPEKISYTIERILYQAIRSAGETPQLERQRGIIDSTEQLEGHKSIIVSGEREFMQAEHGRHFEKIDIAIGKVDYIVYTRADSALHAHSWADVSGLIVSDAHEMLHRFADLVDGSLDYFVAAIYDDVKVPLPEGVIEAALLESSSSYAWYPRAQMETGALVTKGLETIKASGVFDRITAHKSARADNEKVVFLLSSYATEMIWENQAEETLRETLTHYKEPISLYIHSMNFRKTNYRAAQFQTATRFSRSSFMNEYPDVIIAMDNDALQYLQENYAQMFPTVPVVFCGINGYKPGLISGFANYATGLSEYIDPTETVEFALAHNPHINRIYTIFDETSSASPVKASLLKAVEDKYGDKMDEITSCGNQTFAEVVEEIKGFDKNTMLLIGTYFSDKEGQFMSESEVASRLSEDVDIPVYSLMSGYLGYGVVGGRVAYSRSFIAEAANMAMRILDGEEVTNIPIILDYESEDRFNTFIVDKKAADRFGISEKLYKDKAIVLNADKNIFEEYPIQSTAAVALIIVIFVTAILYIMLLQSKRTREVALVSAEKEKENNRMKSDFLARMSHEIRTPLNAIIGIDELILRDNTSEQVRQNALVIKHSGKSLLSIINDILDFSKIESGKMELTLVDYDVGSLMYDTISMIRIRVAEKPITVDVDVSAEFPAYLYGDEIRVRQILLNVLNNSAKYTNEGSIKLQASFEFDSGNKSSGTAVFTISDTGIGIKEEDLEKLFDAFSQVDTKKNRKIEGTGLGLAITETLIKLMDGNISVTSEYEKGSVFTVRIPQKIHGYKPLDNISESFKRHAEQEEKQNADHFVAPDANILAVDDIDANLLVISGLLIPYKVKVDLASSGKEAIDAIKRKNYDFILMDHMMPEMDGMEATKIIRNLNDEKLNSIPIIALTANAISGMKEMYLENGFNDFISKPIEVKELDRIMQDWIPSDKKRDAAEDTETCDVVPELAAIKGINAAEGLKKFGGKVESYEKILLSFAKDLSKKTDEMLSLFAESDFEKLRTCAHTIKGMAGNVGCTEIYELSKSVEEAAHNADYAFVRENTPVLAEKAKTVVDSINENLAE
jgi:signal transduction histidine kinase/CheY-like chemotaxis protein/HPt (histidine-containing phosphotransfer) domain-containing protein